MAKFFYQGHGSYRITTQAGLVIFVDPYIGEGYDAPADLVLITHEHQDHNRIELLTTTASTVIWRAADMLIDGAYQTKTHPAATVTAVPAYNKNHPKDRCVGFLIEVDGIKFYASGDTSTTDFMPEIGKMGIDYAVLPMDGVYNMDLDEAAECAKIINARHVIPVHVVPNSAGLLFEPERAARFDCPNKRIVLPSTEIELN